MRTTSPGSTTSPTRSSTRSAPIPALGVRELTRQIAMAARYRISESTAAKLRDEAGAQLQPDTHDADPVNERHVQAP